MKKIIYTLLIIGLFNACTHREYFKVSSGGSGNVDKDLAQCEYDSEMNAKSNVTQSVILTQNYNNETKEERKSREKRERTREYERENKHNTQVRKLTDLCMRSRGWSWKNVKNK